MQTFDAVLKRLLQHLAERTLQRITGTSIARWLPVELPKVQNLRVDLLGESVDGGLVQLELQSTNDSTMPLRMMEYAVAIARVHGRLPKQVVLYVGRDPLRMPGELKWAGGFIRYDVIDIREVDAEPLLASVDPGDNVIAILGKLGDYREALRVILRKLSGLRHDEAGSYLQALLILAGLRGLEKVVREEAENMPLVIDISQNEVLGPAFTEGGAEVLSGMLEKRFGPLPPWAKEELSKSSFSQVQQLSLRFDESKTLEDVFGHGAH